MPDTEGAAGRRQRIELETVMARRAYVWVSVHMTASSAGVPLIVNLALMHQQTRKEGTSQEDAHLTPGRPSRSACSIVRAKSGETSRSL